VPGWVLAAHKVGVVGHKRWNGEFLQWMSCVVSMLRDSLYDSIRNLPFLMSMMFSRDMCGLEKLYSLAPCAKASKL